jgi:hypothetical protein
VAIDGGDALGPGARATYDGACEGVDTSWSLTTSAQSMNGRAAAILLRRVDEVAP